MTSKYGENKRVAYEEQPSVSLMFLPQFNVFCDLLLNRLKANDIYLFNTIKEQKCC